MKKQVLVVIAGIAFIGAAVFTVVSCSKSEQQDVIKEGIVTQFLPGQEKTEPLIKAFIERYDNYKAGYKTGGEDIALGEAVWTLEAATNYEFRGSKENLTNYSYDSLVTTVNVTIGENNEYFISESDAMELYEDLLAFTGIALFGENETLLVADLEVESVENNKAEIRLITVNGGKGTDPCSISSSDYWYACGDQGKCGSYSGSEGKDAADLINTLLNCTELDGYWTDIETHYDVASYYDNNDDPCFWGMGYQGSALDCLSPQDIQYWFNQAIYVTVDMAPSNKIYVDCLFKDELLLGGGWFHYMVQIRFGIPHYGDPD
jgi:hypothetical protein